MCRHHELCQKHESRPQSVEVHLEASVSNCGVLAAQPSPVCAEPEQKAWSWFHQRWQTHCGLLEPRWPAFLIRGATLCWMQCCLLTEATNVFTALKAQSCFSVDLYGWKPKTAPPGGIQEKGFLLIRPVLAVEALKSLPLSYSSSLHVVNGSHVELLLEPSKCFKQHVSFSCVYTLSALLCVHFEFHGVFCLVVVVVTVL